MNEQPSPHNTQPGSRESGQSFFHGDKAAASSFSGFDLTQGSLPPVPSSDQSSHPQGSDQAFIRWEASEYIHHNKSPIWFVGFGAIMLALFLIAYFLTQAWTFVALLAVMAVALIIIARRPPRILHYALNSAGVQIEQSFYRYSDFRAFGIIADEVLYSVILIPTKRFVPAINLYFGEADGEKIVDVLGSRLPMQEMHLDIVDQLMSHLRF